MPLTREEMRGLQKRRRGYTGGGMREIPKNDVIPCLSRQEVMDWIERFRNDPWQLSEMPVTATVLASLCNMQPITFQKIFDGSQEISQPLCAKMTRFIPEIEERRVVWSDLQSTLQYGRGRGKTVVLYLEPPKNVVVMPRLFPRAGWDIFVACSSCRSRKWLPVETDGKPFVACYTCLPPSQYAALGLVPSKDKLIREFVRKRNG